MSVGTILSQLDVKFGWGAAGDGGLRDILKMILSGITNKAIAGGAAGDHTVSGIATDDILIAVKNIDIGGDAITDLTSEFSITAANTINNAGGTASTGGVLDIWYFDRSVGA